jgi:hypothetical protein
MNRRIIALRGRGSIGKTTTINMFADMLLTRGWTRESRLLHGNGVDITDVYVGADGVRLGVASAGDNFNEVDKSLRILFDANCTIVVCACRTRDMPDANGVVQGTHFAMNQFTNDITFVIKTIVETDNDEQRRRANDADVDRLINTI